MTRLKRKINETESQQQNKIETIASSASAPPSFISRAGRPSALLRECCLCVSCRQTQVESKSGRWMENQKAQNTNAQELIPVRPQHLATPLLVPLHTSQSHFSFLLQSRENEQMVKTKTKQATKTSKNAQKTPKTENKERR